MEKIDKYSIIFDEKKGFHIIDNESGKIADLAVLEGSWRNKEEANPKIVGTPTKKYGNLRIKSLGNSKYDIWSRNPDKSKNKE